MKMWGDAVRSIIKKTAIPILVLLLFSCSPGQAAQPSSEQIKLELAALVEDVLAPALSFERPGEFPDFSTLEQIMPFWDQGKPAEARRKWVSQPWLYHRVKYRVDSIWLSSEVTAQVRGKKTVSYGRMKPLLHWWQNQENKNENYFFIIDAYKSDSGRWLIRSEFNY